MGNRRLAIRHGKGRHRILLGAVILAVVAMCAAPASAAVDVPDDIPGVPLPIGVVWSDMDSSGVDEDVYRVFLPVGTRLTLDDDPFDVDDLELWLFGPGSTSIWDDYAVDYGTMVGDGGITFEVGPGMGGWYYVDVCMGPPGSPYQFNSAVDYIDPWSAEPFCGTLRNAGADRYATGVAISQGAFAEATTCVIASGEGFADALAASPLAGSVGGPVLLVPHDSVPSVVVSEIRRLGASEAIIVGGEAAVGPEVATRLNQLGLTVDRLGGQNRFDTAREIARYLDDFWGGTSPFAFVVNGYGFADALAVSPLAYSSAAPVLLVGDTLPSETAQYINAADIDSIVVAGGTAVVTPGVVSSLDALNGGATDVTKRLAGNDRYQTASRVAAWGVNQGMASYEMVGLANGLGFADALAGGVACGASGGVLALTPPDSLGSAARSVIQQGSWPLVVTFGGEAAVSRSTHEAAWDALP